MAMRRTTAAHLENPWLSVFWPGEEAVLFSRRSRQLYGLDPFGTALLLRLRAGETPEEIVQSGSCPVQAFALIDQLAALLAGEEEPLEDYPKDGICPPEVPAHPPNLPHYRLLDTCFAIKAPAALMHKWIDPSLMHLRVAGSAAPALLITIEPEGPGWDLRFNGVAQGTTLSTTQLLPLLNDRLRKFAYQRSPYLLAIHAAVVRGETWMMILPGQAGSGKSTLAAALLHHGAQLFSDEITVIDAAGNTPALPLGLGVKSGSWPVLEPWYPQLAGLPMHIRRDDIAIRYLLPEDGPFAENGAIGRATHLVFPRYLPNGAGEAVKLSPVQALRALTEAGYQVPQLNEERVAAILDWLAGITAFTLTYSCTEDALARLEKILPDFSRQTGLAGGGNNGC